MTFKKTLLKIVFLEMVVDKSFTLISSYNTNKIKTFSTKVKQRQIYIKIIELDERSELMWVISKHDHTLFHQ